MILDTINVTPRALWRTIYCNCIFVIITIIEYRIKEPIAITCPSKKTITEIREFGILMIYNPALKFVEFICYFSVFLFSTNNCYTHDFHIFLGNLKLDFLFINVYLNLFAEISVIRSIHSKKRKTIDGTLMNMYWLLISV